MASVLDTNALVSWTIAKSFLEEATTDNQNYLEYLINAASKIANQVTGRQLKARTYTAYLDAPFSSRLRLPEYPVHDITSMNDDENRAWTSTDTAWSSTEYKLYGDAGIVRLYDDTFSGGIGTLKVVYNAGYGTTTTGSTVSESTVVPWDLQLAILETVRWQWQRFAASGAGIGVRSKSAEGVNVGMEITIPLHAMKVIEGYKRREYRP